MPKAKRLKSLDIEHYLGFNDSKSNIAIFSDNDDDFNYLLTDNKTNKRNKCSKANIEIEEPIEKRPKSKSMDANNLQRRSSIDTTTLTGAIVMAIKGTSGLTVDQIVEKIRPAFSYLKKNKKNPIVNDMTKSIEGCLNASKNKVFYKDEKHGLWSLEASNNETNYFQQIDKKLTQKPKELLKFNIKKRGYGEYEDIVEKLATCLKCFANKPKVYKMIKKNPFKKLKKNLNTNKTLDHPNEIMLANLINAEDSSNKGERLIGILQCFYYFYPILKELSKNSNLRLSSILNKMQDSVNQINNMIIKSN